MKREEEEQEQLCHLTEPWDLQGFLFCFYLIKEEQTKGPRQLGRWTGGSGG
jgi:hypothetical protein